MRRIPFIQTSVFVDERYSFSGNQLATFWDHKANALSKDEMLGIAREMNFSETTFIFPSELESCIAKVRIFTIGKEMPFAGHPILGTAFVLKLRKILPPEWSKATLEVGIGPIDVEFLSATDIRMSQPKPEFLDIFNEKRALAEALRIKETDISNNYPMQVVSTGNPFLIVPLTSLIAVQKINLNPYLLLKTLENFPTQKVMVFSCETVHDDSHAHARRLAPSGVLEDPATGSATGPLGAYLEKREILENHTKETEINIEQGFEMNRPSRLIVKTVYDKNEIANVLVTGKVRFTAEGYFYL